MQTENLMNAQEIERLIRKNIDQQNALVFKRRDVETHLHQIHDALADLATQQEELRKLYVALKPHDISSLLEPLP